MLPKTVNMKNVLLRIAILAVSALMLAFTVHTFQQPETLDVASYKKKTIIRCTADWEALKQWLEEVDIPPMPGAGTYVWKISTKNDSAQFYFNQGINMYYGFHIIEAMASFKKAAKFDASCAMLHWAQALSYGPNINDFGYRASPEALNALAKAKEFFSSATAFEQALIDAMSVRYTSDSTDATRASLNKAYTAKMKTVYEQYKTIADAHALYADAMMLEHPWDLWNINGTPKAWTPLIRQVLEGMLAKFPMHPGANHYYIHVMEPSPFAKLALPSADRLGITNPGLSHLVHMPSHIYLRTGNYAKGVSVNTSAVNSYKQYTNLFAPVTGADFLYIIHNVHMKANNAMMMGNEAIAVAAAAETQQSIPADYLSIPPPMGSYLQYIYMTPVLVHIRFGNWNELLQLPKPDASQVYANVLYHFGRGMAFANTNKLTASKVELGAIQVLIKDSSLYIPFTPFSPAIDGAVVAEQLLAGTIALKENKLNDAIAAFEKAVTTDDGIVYNEPRDWMLNSKHYLGNAYLQMGNSVKAQAVFERDLVYNNENGWALMGLHKALLMQKKLTEAAAVKARFQKAFVKADVKPEGAVF
jgi:tetratricopeptide (TPR) repeat protein